MKKMICAALCALFCISLCGCDKENGESSQGSQNSQSSQSSQTAEKTVSEKTAQLLDEVEFPSMVEITSENFDTFFSNIEPEDVAEFSAYCCGTGAAPDEFGIFIAKDADAAARIKAGIEKRVQSQYDTFKDYTPDAMYRFDDDFVDVNGTTVIYAICDNNEKAKEILK